MLVDPFGLTVTATLDRRSGALTVVDNNSLSITQAPAFTGGQSATGRGGDVSFGVTDAQVPLPPGTYHIVPNLNPKPGHEDWFGLVAADDRLDDYFDDNGKKRSGARLHLGSVSHGCVTVSKSDLHGKVARKDVVDALRGTKPSSIDVTYGPYPWSPTRRTTSYGILCVR
jgi:hypothetical protein